MSQQSWQEMEEAGWVRRISEKTKRVTYGRPREGGRVKIVSQRRELREGEEGLGDILWPPTHKKVRQEQEPELGEAQEVGEEAEGLMERAELPTDTAEEAMEQVEVQVAEEAEEAGEVLEIKTEHKEELMKMAAVLKEVSLKEMNDINTNEMMFELHKAMREKDNPLRQELPGEAQLWVGATRRTGGCGDPAGCSAGHPRPQAWHQVLLRQGGQAGAGRGARPHPLRLRGGGEGQGRGTSDAGQPTV